MAVLERTDANPDGTRFGQSATDKVAFYGAAPVVQPATIAASTDTTTTTSTTTALTTDLDSLRVKYNDLLAKLKTLGIIAT